MSDVDIINYSLAGWQASK